MVRQARKSDADAVEALWAQLLADHAALDPRFRPADDAPARWRNDFPVWLDDTTRRIFVAEVGGEVVGFVSAHRWSPPPVYVFTSEVYVDELYVRPRMRGQGHGQALMDAVRAWAEELDADQIRLTALAQNPSAVSFWQHQGATPFSTVMVLPLKDAPAAGRPAAFSSSQRKARLGF